VFSPTRKHALISKRDRHCSSGGGRGEQPWGPRPIGGKEIRNTPDLLPREHMIPLPTLSRCGRVPQSHLHRRRSRRTSALNARGSTRWEKPSERLIPAPKPGRPGHSKRTSVTTPAYPPSMALSAAPREGVAAETNLAPYRGLVFYFASITSCSVIQSSASPTA
jgi:hypothetical protein